MSQYFNQLPDHSKVWIYQCHRELSDPEVNQMTSALNDFVQQWTSHSRKVIASGTVLYKRFVILAADETAFTVSGCSIDSSVQFVRQLEQQFGIELFDRLNIAYRENGKINVLPQADFQQLMDNGVVNQDTVVFNNLVATVGGLNQHWEVPLAQSWHSRFFRKKATSA